ncbi:unnamed protein product (mitochondrion) [Plasmodiophora brassicae]|uniref:Amino acid permease/ SLC12A domain-containing protein n=1 Tax=Plasmodiophora brassicae TaxID=37360 RepID=A0A0G4J5H8_PLABS|nr:hypothetical protein PBRA_009145 [Plasmodiophora brassicae]SPQ98435.1 unnamed protein product [Plasmodiophora brassicae]
MTLPVVVVVDDAGAAVDAGKPKRVLSLAHFVFVAFFLTCGGPFGLESAVQAGGVLLTLAGLILLPFLWAVPQSLMTAELSSMMSVNGGSLVWVWRALGNCAGVANAYNSLASALVDLCLYPNLIVGYLSFLQLSDAQAYAAKIAILLVVTLCNAVGLSVVGSVSLVLMVVSCGVFVVEIPFAATVLPAADFLAIPEHVQWSLLSSVLLWSSTGWDALSNFAGEVRNPTRTYPLGIALAMLAGTAANVIPIVVSYALLPDASAWGDDAFLVAAQRISGHGWLVVWVIVAAILANLGQLLAGMAANSRMMSAMGASNKDDGIQTRTLPKILGRICPRFGTPLNALSVQFVVAAVIAYFDFQVLVQFLALLNCFRLALEFAAFIVLKYREPLAERPFVVPGGLVGAWVITVVKTAILAFIVGSIALAYPMVVVIATVVNGAIVTVAYWAGDGCVRTDATSSASSSPLPEATADSSMSSASIPSVFC